MRVKRSVPAPLLLLMRVMKTAMLCPGAMGHGYSLPRVWIIPSGSFQCWLDGDSREWQCWLGAQEYSLLGLEEPPGARSSMGHHSPVLCAHRGSRHPQPCDGHQAYSAGGQPKNAFSSLSGRQRWLQHVLALLGHSAGSRNGKRCLFSLLCKGQTSIPPWSDLEHSQEGNTMISTRYFRKSKTSSLL